MEQYKNNKYQYWAITFIIIGFLVTSIYFFFLLSKKEIVLFADIDFSKIGDFGDFIGGVVGSLWTLAGVLLFFQALKDQRQDIDTNLQLLKAQIEGLEISKKTGAEQEKLLQLQQFETTFFSLFKTFQEITDKLEISDSRASLLKGKKVFSHLIERLNSCPLQIDIVADNNILSASTHFIHEYEKLFEENEELLKPYFEFLFQILLFIKRSNLPYFEQYKYAKIIRSYLVKSELGLLRYHCTRNDTIERLCEEYKLISHLPVSMMLELYNIYNNELESINAKIKKLYPIDLSCIYYSIYNSLFKEFLKQKYNLKTSDTEPTDNNDIGSFEQIYYSLIFVWTRLSKTKLEVSIKIPYDEEITRYLSDTPLKKENFEYYQVVVNLRNYPKLCKLIESIVFEILVLNNYKGFTEGLKMYNLNGHNEVYNTHDNKYKVFRSTFDINNYDELNIQIDPDYIVINDLTIEELLKKNQEERN